MKPATPCAAPRNQRLCVKRYTKGSALETRNRSFSRLRNGCLSIKRPQKKKPAQAMPLQIRPRISLPLCLVCVPCQPAPVGKAEGKGGDRIQIWNKREERC